MSEEGFDIDPELLVAFIDESIDGFESLESLFVKMEENPKDHDITNAIFRPVHTIKGNSAYFGLFKVKELAHELETLLDFLRNDKLLANSHIIDVLLKGTDELKAMMLRVKESEPEVLDQAAYDQLLKQVIDARSGGAEDREKVFEKIFSDLKVFREKLDISDEKINEEFDILMESFEKVLSPQEEEVEAETPKAEEAEVKEAEVVEPEGGEKESNDEGGKEEKASPQITAAKTMRVSENSIDEFLVHVGDLVGVREMFAHMQKRLTACGTDKNVLNEFKNVNETFIKLSGNLQRGIMSIRKIPIKTILQKTPRIIRDIASMTGKQIKVTIEGEDVEIDKSLVDALEGPLTHMVRNSADHGIEMPDVRVAAGKKEVGQVLIKATETPDDMTLSIIDDGKGLDEEKLQKKAVELGLLEEGKKITQKEIINILFMSGVSTAEEVTDISGRGVGMDVVRRNVEAMGGKISVESELGKGCKFHITMPKSVTTTIIPAVIFRIGDEQFAIGQIDVLELVRISEENENLLEEIHGSKVFRLRETLLPLINLRTVLGLPELEENDYTIFVVQVSGVKLGIIVDEVVDMLEIVSKQVGRLVSHVDVFSGAAILGDGRLIMIVDPLGVVKRAGANQLTYEDNLEDDSMMVKKGSGDEMTFLVFEANPKAPQAIALSLINRLEEIPKDKIEEADGKLLVQYRGSLLPLIKPNNYEPIESDAPQSVIVFSDGEKSMGLMVNRILDIITDEVEVDNLQQGPGVLGVSIIGGKATELVDIHYYLQKAYPDWFLQKAGNAKKNKRHLLLIDDSQFFRELLKPALETNGFQVTMAKDGEEGLEKLKELKESIDLVLSDINMPNLDGWGLIKEIRSRESLKDIPVFALTSLQSPEDRKRGLEAGFQRYLLKLDRDAIVAEVIEALEVADNTQQEKQA